jgi:hypothetical protein
MGEKRGWILLLLRQGQAKTPPARNHQNPEPCTRSGCVFADGIETLVLFRSQKAWGDDLGRGFMTRFRPPTTKFFANCENFLKRFEINDLTSQKAINNQK